MPVFLERFVLAVLAAVVVGVIVTNPFRLDLFQQIGATLAVVGLALFVGATVERMKRQAPLGAIPHDESSFRQQPAQAAPLSSEPTTAVPITSPSPPHPAPIEANAAKLEGGASVKHKRDERAQPDKPTFQQTNQPGSVGVQGIGNQVTINPPANPSAPVLTWDFNGARRTTSPGRHSAVAGEEFGVFQRLMELHERHEWRQLAAEAEAQIQNTPDWLTPYLLAGIAHLNSGNRNDGISRLQFVASKSGGDPEYDDAIRILKELGLN